jgi:ribosomal protein S18 acetylase RimI-like enzyme
MRTLDQGYDKVGRMVENRRVESCRVEIRELTEADIDPVAALNVRSWQAGYAGIVPVEVLDALDPARFAARRRQQSVPAGARTVVADDAGTIVGFASFGPSRAQQAHDEYDRSAGEIYAIYVDPDRWGSGVGRLLIAAAVEGLTLDYPEMRLWVLEENHRARRFYERAGMAPDGARDFYTPPGGDAELPEIRYSRRLA